MKMNPTLFQYCFGSFLLFQAVCLDPDFVASKECTKLKLEVKDLAKQVDSLTSRLSAFIQQSKEFGGSQSQPAENRNDNLLQREHPLLNDTLEERVAILEFQVAGITDDIATINNDVTTLNTDVTDLQEDLDVTNGEVAVILAGQVLQDERILELENESDGFDDSISALESAVTTVDNKVEVVNFTLTEELQELEAIVTGHNGRIEDLEAGLTSVEETVSQIDTRLSQLEVTGTVAFQAELVTYTTIPEGSIVLFDVMGLNLGNGYNNLTGQFTVPSDGPGLYFFFVNLYADNDEYAHFDIVVNGETLCTAYTDMNEADANDNGTPSCGAVTTLAEGDVVTVTFVDGTDDTPLEGTAYTYNTFTGFRIAPE